MNKPPRTNATETIKAVSDAGASHKPPQKKTGGGASSVGGSCCTKPRFDSETGAIDRENIPYGVKKHRGYGRTEAHDKHPFLKPQISLICGPTGSGKTILALNLLDEIFANVNHKRLGKVMFYSGSPQDQALQELDPESVSLYGSEQEQSLIDDLHALESSMRNTKDEDKPLNILVLDDTGASKLLAPSQVKGSAIGAVFVAHRHLGLHLVILAQRIKGSVSPWILANMSQCFLFSGKSKQDTDALLANIPLVKEQIEKALAIISTEPHQFLKIDLVRRTVTKGFDDVILQ